MCVISYDYCKYLDATVTSAYIVSGKIILKPLIISNASKLKRMYTNMCILDKYVVYVILVNSVDLF